VIPLSFNLFLEKTALFSLLLNPLGDKNKHMSIGMHASDLLKKANTNSTVVKETTKNLANRYQAAPFVTMIPFSRGSDNILSRKYGHAYP